MKSNEEVLIWSECMPQSHKRTVSVSIQNVRGKAG